MPLSLLNKEEKRAGAVLFGLALGDALGWPVEFKQLHEIQAIYGPKGIQNPPNPALYTDDTQMTIALTEGILDAGVNAPIDAIMEKVGARFIAWSKHPETDPRAPGNTCLKGVRAYKSGVPWRESGLNGSLGCGSAMRVATIGYLYQNQPERLREVASASSMITHGHSGAVASAVAAAYAVKLALDGVSPDEYVQRIMDFVGDISPEFDTAILRIGHVLAWTDELEAVKHIGQGWIATEAVAVALYAVMKYPTSFVGAVRLGANHSGDSDSTASIAGGVSAALLGIESIPEDWIERCEHRDEIVDLVRRMAHAKSMIG